MSKTLILALLFTSLSFSQEELLYSTLDPLVSFSKFLETINENQSDHIACSKLGDYSFSSTRKNTVSHHLKPRCNWRAMCKPIRMNRKKFELYKNSNGETIPSSKAAAVNNAIISCLSRLPGPDLEITGLGSVIRMSSVLHPEFSIDMQNIDFSIDKIVNSESFKKSQISKETGRKVLRNIKKAKLHNVNEINLKISFIKKMSHKKRMQLIDSPALLKSLYEHLPLVLKEEFKIEFNRRSEVGYKVYKEVKNEMISMLVERKIENDNSMINIINRVEAIKFKIESFEDYLSNTRCYKPNAYYSSLDHSVSLCPQFGAYPRETIASVIAHEVAHSFDPCFLTSGLLKLKKIEKAQDDQSINFRESKYTLDIYNNVKFGGSDQGELLDRVYPGVNSKNGPFNGEVQCLESVFGTNIRVNDKTRIDKYLAHLKKNNSAYAKKLSNEESVYEDLRHCSIDSRYRTEGGEVFSDLISSQIVARRLKKAPIYKRREMAYESVAIFLEESCMEDTEFEDDLLTFAQNAGCKKIINVKTSFWEGIKKSFTLDATDSPHPKSKDRIKEIYLSNPTVAKSLGCRKLGVSCGL